MRDYYKWCVELLNNWKQKNVDRSRTKEQVNVDFAFIEKSKMNDYEYQIIKQADMKSEGSDHRPIITIN